MYYVINKAYVGVNADQHLDDDVIYITTQEPTQEQLTTVLYDYSYRLLGEYDEQLDAETAVIEGVYGDVRVSDHHLNAWEPATDDAIATFRCGKYAPLSSDEIAEYAAAIVDEYGFLTDAEIRRYAIRCQIDAQIDLGCTASADDFADAIREYTAEFSDE